MSVTNYTYGVSSAGTVIQAGLTTITGGAGTVTTSLDTVALVNVSIAGVPGTATGSVYVVAGTAHANATAASSFIVKGYNAAGNAGTAATPIAWVVAGSKA